MTTTSRAVCANRISMFSFDDWLPVVFRAMRDDFACLVC